MRPHPTSRVLGPLVGLLLLTGLLVAASTTPAGARAADPVEDYAAYDPQSHCSPKAKPGAKALQAWMVTTYGGAKGPISRPCTVGGVSEHKEGRALDWTLDATKKRDRRRAAAFLTAILATDADGNAHALARRMGVMYVIWNDHMWASYDHFARKDYLSSSCPSKKRCSATLRHRDHLHVSLSRAGGRGRTSWYDGRVG